MPKFKVKTDQGAYLVELDRQPDSPEQLRSLIEGQLSGGGRPTADQGAFPVTGFEAPAYDPTQGAAFARRHVLPAVLPTLGTAAGAATGGLVTLPSVAGVPLGVLAGEAAGGSLGEAANQLLGITEPSGAQIALAGAAPGAGRVLGAGLSAARRFVASKLPGAGYALRQAGAEAVEGLPGTIRPSPGSESLYAVVDRFNPSVDLSPVKAAADKIATQQAPRAEFGVEVPGGVGRVISKTRQALAPPKPEDGLVRPGTSAPIEDIAAAASQAADAPARDFQSVRTVMRGINDKIGALKAQGGEGFGEMLQLKRAFAESLERSAEAEVGPAAQALKAANTAYRQELASDTLTDIIAKNKTWLEGREGVNVAAGKAMKQLSEAVRKDKFLAESFPPGALDRIMSNLDKVRQLPVIGAPPGAERGAGLFARRAGIGGAAGGALAGALGMDVIRGVEAGAIAGAGVSDVISRAIQTERGTRMLLRLVQEGKGLDRPALALIASSIRSESAGVPQEGAMISP